MKNKTNGGIRGCPRNHSQTCPNTGSVCGPRFLCAFSPTTLAATPPRDLFATWYTFIYPATPLFGLLMISSVLRFSSNATPKIPPCSSPLGCTISLPRLGPPCFSSRSSSTSALPLLAVVYPSTVSLSLFSRCVCLAPPCPLYHSFMNHCTLTSILSRPPPVLPLAPLAFLLVAIVNAARSSCSRVSQPNSPPPEYLPPPSTSRPPRIPPAKQSSGPCCFSVDATNPAKHSRR